MATATTDQLNAVKAALQAEITALQQRCARLEATVKTLQGELSRVKRG